MTLMHEITVRMKEVSSILDRTMFIASLYSGSRKNGLSFPFHRFISSLHLYSHPQDTDPKAFLSWLRLSIYMAIVSVAIMISFHLKNQPTQIEKQAALPFGIIFWLLSLACLASGLANYIKTVTKYSHREALVQSGWKTQMVSSIHLSSRWSKAATIS